MFNVNTTAKTMDEALPSILSNLLAHGEVRESRNGKVLELPMARVHLTEPSSNPYLTNPLRKASVAAQIAETVWVLSGRNDIEFIDRFLPRAKDFSDDGKTWRGGYGPRLRAWQNAEGETIDQVFEVARMLHKDPEDRRAVIQIFDPELDLNVDSKDVPCNNWLSFIVRDGKLHTHVAVRSNDAFWGLSGINAFEWTFLGQVIAYLAGVQPGSLTFSTTSLHLYEHHWSRANKIASADVEELGGLESTTDSVVMGDALLNPPSTFEARWNHFILELKRMEEFLELNADQMASSLSVATRGGSDFYLFRHWKQIISSYMNNSEPQAILGNSNLFRAFEVSPKRKVETPPAGEKVEKPDPYLDNHFMDFVSNLHEEKNKAYGDSWMRRGQTLGILANIARKVDRLGKPGAGDAELDTTVDLLLYLVKYQLWLSVKQGYNHGVVLQDDRHHTEVVHGVLLVDAASKQDKKWSARLHRTEDLQRDLRERFETLAIRVESGAKSKSISELVEEMAVMAYLLAKREHHKKSLETKPFTGYDV